MICMVQSFGPRSAWLPTVILYLWLFFVWKQQWPVSMAHWMEPMTAPMHDII
ncbi:hypothetical protein BC940DRAFT_312285 [Gongronella butleri]|nr:hypothetical protein BC940DRAFT_312285 [Gongronella butleri]